jgi:hypothetical protein
LRRISGCRTGPGRAACGRSERSLPRACSQLPGFGLRV